MRTLELAVTTRNGMAVFNAIFKDTDIRLAVLAYASDDEVAFGDEAETGHLGVSRPILFGNGVNYFLNLELTPNFIFAFRQGVNGTEGV